MQFVDIGIIMLLVLSAVIGVLYGFLNIVFSIVAWTLASVIAAKFGGYFAPMLSSFIHNSFLQKILAFVAVFIVSLMILAIIAYLIKKLLWRTGLTGADRILGLFFGMGLGSFIVAVIIFLAGFFPDIPKQQWWRDSVMIQSFQVLAEWVHQYLPEDFSSHHGYESTDESEQLEGTGIPS